MKHWILAGVLFCLCVGVLSPQAQAGTKKPPGPQLMSPADNEDITGKQTLEFRWTAEGDRSSFDRYDFRLYEGPAALEKGLILQKDIPMGKPSIEVDASLFKDGQTYAWSVRQEGKLKSRTTVSVFKVTNKTAS